MRFITEARWIADTLERLHPGEKVLYVRNGLAKDVFAPVDASSARRASAAAADPDRGQRAACRSRASHEARRRVRGDDRRRGTSPSSRGDGSAARVAGVDRAAGPVSQAQLAALYAESDVLLKLSRVEGMFGPPLEAFHKGATCVVTPVTGHDEYIVHGENGLVVDWDDPPGTTRALELLARDRDAAAPSCAAARSPPPAPGRPGSSRAR